MRTGIPGLLAAIMTVFVLFTLTGYQITTETASTRLLGRLGAAMIEIDRWVPAHQEDLDLLGRDRPTDLVTVRDLPVEVTLPAAQLIGSEPEELTVLLRDAMGQALYDNGTDAFKTGEGSTASLGIDEPVRWTVELLESGMHGFWQAALAVTTLLLLALCAAVLTTGRWPLGPIAVGATVAAVFSLIAWGLAQLLASSFDSPIDRETALILRDGAWIGLRNSAAVAVAATVLLFALSRSLGDQRPPAYSRPARDPENSPF